MKEINWNYLNDALSYLDKAEIELDDFRDSLECEIAIWRINFIRNQISYMYNKLIETKEFIKNDIRTIQTHKNG